MKHLILALSLLASTLLIPAETAKAQSRGHLNVCVYFDEIESRHGFDNDSPPDFYGVAKIAANKKQTPYLVDQGHIYPEWKVCASGNFPANWGLPIELRVFDYDPRSKDDEADLNSLAGWRKEYMVLYMERNPGETWCTVIRGLTTSFYERLSDGSCFFSIGTQGRDDPAAYLRARVLARYASSR